MSDALQINGPRLLHSLHELGQFGALPGGGTNRLALSDAQADGRQIAGRIAVGRVDDVQHARIEALTGTAIELQHRHSGRLRLLLRGIAVPQGAR